MVYLTFGDKYGGVYQSQVIDVLKFVNGLIPKEVLLLAGVPYPIYFKQKKLIRSEYSKSIIFPVVPGRMNLLYFHLIPILFLSLFGLFRTRIVCRGIQSTNLALLMKKIGLVRWVCYDGRGAIYSEWKEYLGKKHKVDLTRIYYLEKRAVVKSDFRIAVSHELLNYWKENYAYNGLYKDYKVIPTTISSYYDSLISDEYRLDLRKKYGINSNDLVVVFSGGVDKWQSPELIGEVMQNLLDNNQGIKFLFLTKPGILNHPSILSFKKNIISFWVQPNEVRDLLSLGDYGLLIREESTTNVVAAPTKFAEYLACGLRVIISNGVGDYTDFVKKNRCGIVYQKEPIKVNSSFDRKQSFELAMNNFSKSNYLEAYRVIFG